MGQDGKQDTEMYMGGRQVWDCVSFYIARLGVFILLRDREDKPRAPGFLPLLLAADSLAKPCKLLPTESFLQVLGILLLRIERGMSVRIVHREYN
jgi:hypothetical protein